VTVSATSVAAGGLNISDCLCLEGTTGTDLNMSNNAKFTGGNCAIRENSTSSNAITVVGSANLCAQAIGTAAAWDDTSGGANVNNGGSVCSTATLVPGLAACAPAMPNVPVDANCTATSGPSSWTASYTTGPNSTYGTTINGNTVCYSNGLDVNGNGQVTTLNPGIYVINGKTLHFNSGGPNLGGNGVVFYLTNGANLAIDNGANVILWPGAIRWRGAELLKAQGFTTASFFYQDPGYPAAANDPTNDAGDAQPISIQGGSTVFINGEIVAPLADVTLGNGSSGTVAASMVVKSLTMNGGGTLTSSASTNLGNLSVGGASYLVQ